MKLTETPAYRPTAASIWHSFLNSGKRHLILTGGRGAGKSTRIRSLCAGMPGIVTTAVPQDGVYLEVCSSGKKVRIGVFDPALPGATNRMRICPEGFGDHAVPAVQKLCAAPAARVFIDEIGYLESGSEAYMNAIRDLFGCKQVIASIRKQDIPFLKELSRRDDAFCVDLDAPYGHTGCVIMASGMSKRFGGNKLLADFHGIPMIGRALSATEGIFARRTVVTRHPEIAEMCRETGIDCILHDQPFRSDTVRLGLEAIGAADACMFCPADQPMLKKETIASLVLCGVHDPSAIWRPCFGGSSGSPVLFPAWAFDGLMHLPQGKGGGYIIQQHPERVRLLPVRDAHELTDADDRDTYSMLLRLGTAE